MFALDLDNRRSLDVRVAIRFVLDTYGYYSQDGITSVFFTSK